MIVREGFIFAKSYTELLQTATRQMGYCGCGNVQNSTGGGRRTDAQDV